MLWTNMRVACPSCLTLIARVARDVPPGEEIAARDFAPLLGASPFAKGTGAMTCPKCGAPTWRRNEKGQMQIYTELGWRP